MDIDDVELPAAAFLTGEHAVDVLAPAVEASGGRLEELRLRGLHYRPGRELVVSYSARVGWTGRGAATETLLAAATDRGALPGTLPVVAEHGGRQLEVGVWRYPFDPVVTGMPLAVSRRHLAKLLGVDERSVELTVRSFRPCRRAVVHAIWTAPDGAHAEAFVKVVAPADLAALVERHRVLLAAGLPVPRVLAEDRANGIAVLEALPGEDLRSRVLSGGPVPSGREVWGLVDRIAAVPAAVGARVPTPLIDAVGRHAKMLGVVEPSLGERLAELVDRIEAAPAAPPSRVTVHGDLHDGQLRVDGAGRIVGLLDLDDLGPGDPLDDPARLIGHLLALAVASPEHRVAVLGHVRRLRAEYPDGGSNDAIDRRVAAALVGLATGPVRTQRATWQSEVLDLLDLAAKWCPR